MSCPNAANVNIKSFPSGECLPVEGCPGGPPVEVTGPDGAPVDVTFPMPVPVTIADCADVAQGCVNDARSGSGDLPGTISAKLRQIAFKQSQGVSGTPGYTNTQPVVLTVDQISSGRFMAVADIQDGNLGSGNNILFQPHAACVVPWAFTGVSGNFPLLSVQRIAFNFNTVQAVAGGNTALWTPTAGFKFRLLRYCISITGNASMAAPAVLTVSLFDGAAGATGQAHDFYVPAAGGIVPGMFTTGWIDITNGYLSVAANNILNVNLSAALATGNVRVVCCGTEES